MEYIVENKKYSLSYQELKGKYLELSILTTEEFKKRLPEILHFSCIVSYLKEFGNESFSDEGLVHQLCHLLHIPDEPLIDAEKIRNLFIEQMKLS